MQNFACKEDCLLRVILEKTTRRIQFNCELIADLSDLQHNEPGRLHEVVTKLQIINDVQKEKLKDARHLRNGPSEAWDLLCYEYKDICVS